MIYEKPLSERESQRQTIDRLYRADETAVVRDLLQELDLPGEAQERIQDRARRLVEAVRRTSKGGIDAFLHEYGLSTQEGVMLMCIAEALLRIPDDETQEALIRDKISAANWDRHLGHSDSLFVNASTWALMLTGRVVGMHGVKGQSAGAMMRRLVARMGEPVIREAVNQSMRIMGRQFIMGRTIESALERAEELEKRGYRYSYDMLGEAARTMKDADRFFDSYRNAIRAIGKASEKKGVIESPGISVKLSALHPRYELAQEKRVMDELLPRMQALAVQAAEAGIGLNIDAEEAARLDLSLDVIDAISASRELKGWDGFGVVVQAYQKRAPMVIDWLAEMAGRDQRRLMVRLVKGAYWDTEIKLAQELALRGYPVFTRKVNTDVCYLACARKLLDARETFYPQFATHNAHSVAAVLEFAGNERGFEFQRLHGMGEELYEEIVEKRDIGIPCRIYAPVGQHEDLLPYLVRRLLENGANSSFVNRIQDEDLPVDEIIADPVRSARGHSYVPNPKIPLPCDLYGAARKNFSGLDLTDRAVLSELKTAMETASEERWTSGPIVSGEKLNGQGREVASPADRTRIVGAVRDAGPEEIERALGAASTAAAGWSGTPANERADCLRKLAALMEEETPRLMAIAVGEAGKTIPDALAEVREAVDFCRYYALRAEADMAQPDRLRVARDGGSARLEGGGVFCCISPWNFPLAIFAGQITAALAAGNAVIAKPAEQTPLIAAAGVELMHRAGIPGDVIQLLPGDGKEVGGPLVADPRITGVCFTGSTEVALLINRQLARRDGPVVPLIAETGGQNAMIVDSSALPEQVVQDVIMSSFQSAGQRCSALRVLFLQDDVADRMLEMLAGAMDELVVSDPALLSTDIGPVIDDEAEQMLTGHIRRMRTDARLIKQVRPGRRTDNGTFVGPAAFELDRLSRLQREVFGPVLHVIRYQGERRDEVVEAINATGYGLTHGIHSRIDDVHEAIFGRVHVGNTYVNRNQIGAIVGVQPFGGEGLSGTGPKAGGPHYLPRFTRQRLEAGDEEAGAGAHGTIDLGQWKLDRKVLDEALAQVGSGSSAWSATPVEQRAAALEAGAERLEWMAADLAEFDSSGADGVALAVDHLHAAAAQARSDLAAPLDLPGPTGEKNQLTYAPRGVLACIGAEGAGIDALAAQVATALAGGNAVLLWHHRPEAAAKLTEALHEAGVPGNVLMVLGPGRDASISDVLADRRLDGVAYAGPAAGGKAVQRALAEREGAILPLIPVLERGAEGAGNPLAGSRHYLYRFLPERALSVNTAAAGGNASLFAMADG
jgi:RHH-type proline utilization regulon transcriptional repressor/proline dehydrogenase/delta 1-pyrroline-5-carboxylate dehydrogenase